MARQAAADRAWQAVAGFYQNCREKKPGKQGYPRFQHDNRSAEDKTSGWRLEPDGKHLTFTARMGIGRLTLIGKQGDIETFPLQQIKRVRLVKRADGYSCQFAVQADRQISHEPTGKRVGIDVGLKAFSTASSGASGANPRYLRRAEKRLKRLAKGYLKVSRLRKDFAANAARALVKSSA